MGRRVTDSAAIESRVQRAMSALAAHGIEEGDAVALLLRNDIAFLEASLAVSRLGAYGVPLNWHAKPNEVEIVLRDSQAKLLIAHADLLAALGAVSVPAVAVTTPQEILEAYALDARLARVPAGAADWNAWIEVHSAWSGANRRPRGSIIYTSGTTGTPKGIQREPTGSADQERLVTQTLRDSFGVRPEGRSLVCGPLYHSMQGANLRAAYDMLGERGVLVIESRFDAERLLARVAEHRITQILMVPVMFVRLLRLDAAVRTRYRLDSLEWVVHSAAPCPIDVKKGMIEWFGPVMHEFYAASEFGAVALIGSADALRKPGSVGRALPGCIVKVLDASGRELPVGATGEIAALNTAYPDFTYRNRPEARAALDRGGLIATGDIGHMDEEGFLFLSGRSSDMVISGGVNIFPAEIEEVLLGCPGVADCAVFGIPDEEYGEALAAHIQPLPQRTLDELEVRAWLRERLPGFKTPRVIRFEAALPREDSGKIFKRRLREPYWTKR